MCGVEGRDKFCKMIQYGSRFIKYQADGKNQDVHNAFKGLFGKYMLLLGMVLTGRLTCCREHGHCEKVVPLVQVIQRVGEDQEPLKGQIAKL